MNILRKLFKKINIDGTLLYDELLSDHSTFKIGGQAEIFASPASVSDMEKILSIIKKEAIPYFVLGGGANTLFHDKGFKGVIINTSLLNSVSFKGNILTVGAGVAVSEQAKESCCKGFSGLEYFYGMPGSVGGSIYMNARCYGKSISDLKGKVTYIDDNGDIGEYIIKQKDFDYKKSPFMETKNIILEAVFQLEESAANKVSKKEIEEKMISFKKEREEKGHYQYPSAGSVFKNNKDFGEPTGKIINNLGLKGLSQGGVMISPLHANIIVNTGKGRAEEVKTLVEIVKEKVFKSYGFSLEREIIYADCNMVVR